MKGCALISALIVIVASTSASADWRLSPNAGWLNDAPSAHGLSDQGVHNLHLTCSEGIPKIFTNGFPAVAGKVRLGSFELVVDGKKFKVTGEHSPPDGMWSGVASLALIEALKRGHDVTLTPHGLPSVQISMNGASLAIEAALENCTTGAYSSKTRPVRMRMLIAETCRGDFSLDEGAEMTGLIDDDDQPDTVIFWGAVRCQNPEQGYSAFCGAANCAVSVLLTQTLKAQELLAPKVELHRLASGRSVLRTYVCRTGNDDCPIEWRWNGKSLEPKR